MNLWKLRGPPAFHFLSTTLPDRENATSAMKKSPD
jgi:hypothetical protein